MADIGASINIMQKALKDLRAQVDKGSVLSPEEAQQLMQLKREVDGIKYVDNRNEVIKGRGLKTVTDKWQ
ncbi:hypothetical protein D9M68_18610 [compost metagenome]